MLNLDDIVSNNKSSSECNDWPFRMLIIGPSGSGKTNAFMEYSNDMDDVFDNINNYNKNRDKKVLIIFDDMIADIMRSEKFKAIVKELFIRCRKLNISIVFITQSHFRTPKDVRLYTHCILMKIGSKKELKSIAEEKSGYLDYKDFLIIYNYCTKQPYSFMMIDTRPTASVTFKKNFDEPTDLCAEYYILKNSTLS